MNTHPTTISTVLSQERTEDVEHRVETRRVGPGPNGLPVHNAPTDWWLHEVYETLDAAVSEQRRLTERASQPGSPVVGREFRAITTRCVVVKTVEVYS